MACLIYLQKMPQLDIYSYVPQLFWIFIYFYIFLFCIYSFIYFWNFKTEVLRNDYSYFSFGLKKTTISGMSLYGTINLLYRVYQYIYFADFFNKISVK